ncbi:hypothetical protein D068_cds17540 [Bacillus atrophaeus UCMB-5137]|nr:hypothetical protein D068_cds17540 [Bacillus atrophaeus UCMB-5137]
MKNLFSSGHYDIFIDNRLRKNPNMRSLFSWQMPANKV